MALKFIHLTDTHVVGDSGLLYGLNPLSRLRATVDSINAEHGDAAFVVHTGDMTEYGDEDGFRVFAEEMSRLSMPVHLVMGNHDEIRQFADHFPGVSVDKNGFAQSVIETSVGRFLMLDTHVPRVSEGGYCLKRCDWLSEQLSTSDDPVFICMHHPPMDIGIYGMDAYQLQDREAFHDVIAPHKARIRHIFLGHVHRVFYGNWRGISFSCMRGTNHQVALDLDTENSLILGNAESPAYGVALVDDDTVLVHMHDFADRSPRFDLDTEDPKAFVAYARGLCHPGFEDSV